MSVENPGVVDAVGVINETGAIALTISDHLDWQQGSAHLLKLQDKLNRYLAFIESGELLEKYPEARGRPVRIDVYFQHSPNPEARKFLAEAEATVRRAGFAFGWRVLAA